MSLYKYFSPERIVHVLADATLAVSLASERNDPFDELISIEVDTSDEELRRRHALNSIQIPVEEYASIVRDEQHRAAGSARLRAKQEECYGAISFSRVWDSIPMWSYYACEHQGFVIEFDETHPAFFIK